MLMPIRALAIALVACLFGVEVPKSLADSVPGVDCSLCSSAGRGEVGVIPPQGTADILTKTQRNLASVANCLDITILGTDRDFKADGPWLKEVRTLIANGSWILTRETGLPDKDPPYTSNAEKVTQLFRVVFGQSGREADGLPIGDKAELTCKAIFHDMDGAMTSVTKAAQ